MAFTGLITAGACLTLSNVGHGFAIRLATARLPPARWMRFARAGGEAGS
jgi:hypothetical protein